jgi:hypothetical protein
LEQALEAKSQDTIQYSKTQIYSKLNLIILILISDENFDLTMALLRDGVYEMLLIALSSELNL